MTAHVKVADLRAQRAKAFDSYKAIAEKEDFKPEDQKALDDAEVVVATYRSLTMNPDLASRTWSTIVVDESISVVDAHHIADETEHRLLHNVRRLTAAIVHTDPRARAGSTHHEVSAHHRASLF